MITRIEALNYRCLRHVEQDIGAFQALVGPNGSGKSTFLDVMAFLRDMVRFGPDEAVATRAMDHRELFWMRTAGQFKLAIEVAVPADRVPEEQKERYNTCRYEVVVGCQDERGVGLTGETLWLTRRSRPSTRQMRLFPSPLAAVTDIKVPPRRPTSLKLVNKSPKGNDVFYTQTGKWNPIFQLGPHKSALGNLPDDETRFPTATWFRRFLSEGLHVVALDPRDMRPPCPITRSRGLLTDGSNLPWVVRSLAERKPDFAEWVGHLQVALRDLETVETVLMEDKSCYVNLRFRSGLKVPSWAMSDGTLRMLALTVLAYVAEPGRAYLIEEPENGIHPAALEAVFQSLTSVYEGQVLVATHSPVMVSMTGLEQLLCFAKSEDGAVDVVSGTHHPRLRNWHQEVSLGSYLAGGVLG